MLAIGKKQLQKRQPKIPFLYISAIKLVVSQKLLLLRYSYILQKFPKY